MAIGKTDKSQNDIEKAVTTAAEQAVNNRKAELEEIEKLVATALLEVDMNPHLTSTQRDDIKKRILSAAAGGNLQNVQAAVLNADRQADAVETAAVTESVVMVAIYADYALDQNEWRRVNDRSAYINLNDERSIYRFVEALVDKDIPAEIRADVVKNVAEMVKRPEMAKTMEAYNNASKEARTVENARMEQGGKDIEAAKKKPALKETATEADILGTKVDAKAQKALEENRQGKKSDTETNTTLKQSNIELRQQVTKNIEFAKTIVGSDVRRRAEALGDDKQIADRAIEILKARKEGKDPKLTRNDLAALEVFYVAKEKAVIDRLSQNVVARDLELAQGTQQERITRAVEALKNDPAGQFKYMSDGQLQSVATAFIANIDEKKITADGADQLKGKEQAAFMKEMFDESYFGTSLSTATKHMSTGVDAMKEGDWEKSNEAAKMTGLGAKNTLKKWGVGEDKAQMAGHAVTTTLGVTGTVVTNAVEGASEGWQKAKLAWNLNDDITKNFPGKDREALAKIQAGLKKYGSDMLREVDVDRSGNLSKEEMTALLAKIEKLEEVAKGTHPVPGNAHTASLPNDPSIRRS